MKDVIRLLLKKLEALLLITLNFIRNDILLDGYVFFENGKIINNNFGDDINIPILQALSERRIRLIDNDYLKKLQHLICIGSILDWKSNRNSIIWGTGAMHGQRKIVAPKKVYAVRGQLTRTYLLNQGIACPEVYGDPALLLPLVYHPMTTKKYKFGFIPHYIDYNLPHVKKFREEHPEVLFIKFQGYNSWQDVIDQINSCEKIVSSSLHGLIVSDAYKIPNVRVILSNKILGGEFKYKDYFSGVSREYYNPIDCTNLINWNAIINQFDSYVPIEYDVNKLLKSFPYKLKKEYQAFADI